MTPMADKIMKRVSAHDSGRWVCTPKDFLDLGSREAVDQLRRVGVRIMPDGLVAANQLGLVARTASTAPTSSCGRLRFPRRADLDERTKKLLAFTDNRQDASLQAGHFNDFIQILLLRGALLAAIQRDTGGRLTDDVLTQQVLDNLHLDATNYAANPESKGIKAQNTLKTLRDILGYRLYFDLQRPLHTTRPWPLSRFNG